MLLTLSLSQQIGRLVTVAAIALVLSACGFHLRGNIPLSDGIKNMYISGPESSFKDVLRQRLQNLGANLVATSEAGDVVLEIRKADSSRTVGTLDERGKANSYNLRFNVNYVLLGKNGEAIRPVSRIRESRRYNFDPELVVESESEEAELLEDMEQEAVLKVIRQLAAITDYDPNAVPKPADQ